MLNIFHNILKAHVGINGIIIIHGLFVLRHWLAIIHVLFWVSETDKTIENSRFWFESIGVRDSDTNLNARNHDWSKKALLERRNMRAAQDDDVYVGKGFRVCQFLFCWLY